MNKSIAILGGGFAGLWTAAQLVERGYPVDVYERSEHPGGLLRSLTWNGMAIDVGPHIYFADYRHWYERYLDTPLERVDAYYAFGFRGRQIRSPITPRNMLKDLPLGNFVLLTASFLWGQLVSRDKGPATNAEQWAVSKYGRTAYDYFFREYIPKLTGLPADRISPDWGNERERFYKQHNLFQKASRMLAQFIRGEQGGAAPLELYYAPAGAERIIDGLCRYLEANGGRLHTGHSVESITAGDDGVTIEVSNGNGRHQVRAERAINTLTLPQLIRRMEGTPERIRRSAAALRHRHLWCFYFVLRRPRVMDKMQIYFPEPQYLFKRIYEAPPQGHDTKGFTCLCAEVCYSPGDAVDGTPEEEMAARVRGQLMEYYKLGPEELEHSFTLRAPNAYAVYTTDYRRHLDPIAEYLFQQEGVISFGRAGLFRYNALTDRIIDAGQGLLAFLESGQNKRSWLRQPQPKGDFF